MKVRLAVLTCRAFVLVTCAFVVPSALTGAALDDAPILAELNRMGCEVHVGLLTDGQTTQRIKMGEKLSDDLFAQLGKLRHLSVLDLWLPVEHSGSAYLRGLPELRTLRELALTGPAIDDSVTQYIGAMTNLESLKLRSVSISETGLVRLVHLKALKHLELGTLKPITHRGLRAIAALSDIEDLLIIGNYEKGALLELRPLAKLATISVGGPHIDDQLAELRTLPNVTTVKISHATITPGTADRLLTMRSLRSLELDCCDVEPEAARRMQSLHLKRLHCYGAGSKAYKQLLEAVGPDLWDLHAASDN